MFTNDVFVDSFVTVDPARGRHARSLGAIFGGLLAWAVVRGDPNGLLRQLVIAASGVLAQFGGVMLAFAFLATFGFNGLVDAVHPRTLHSACSRTCRGCTA